MLQKLEQIEKAVKSKSSCIITDIDETDDGKDALILTVTWCDSGYRDDEIDREHKLEELYRIKREIQKEHDVTIIEHETGIVDDERESLMILLD